MMNLVNRNTVLQRRRLYTQHQDHLAKKRGITMWYSFALTRCHKNRPLFPQQPFSCFDFIFLPRCHGFHRSRNVTSMLEAFPQVKLCCKRWSSAVCLTALNMFTHYYLSPVFSSVYSFNSLLTLCVYSVCTAGILHYTAHNTGALRTSSCVDW